MIHANLELHSVAELGTDAARTGLRMQRLPGALRPLFNATAKDVAMSPTHVELSRDAQRLVVVVTIFPGAHDLTEARRPAEPRRQILRDLIARLGRPNLGLLEGSDLLDWRGLSSELINPIGSGHAQMGARATLS